MGVLPVRDMLVATALGGGLGVILALPFVALLFYIIYRHDKRS